MPPHVLHCWSYGQGRWRGHHWQWPRARLHQSQHLHPCSGCPRCSDAMTPTCRRRPSALAVDTSSGATCARSPRGFLRRPHSAQPTECGRHKNPRGERVPALPGDVRRKAHLVVQRFVIVDEPMTRATSQIPYTNGSNGARWQASCR